MHHKGPLYYHMVEVRLSCGCWFRSRKAIRPKRGELLTCLRHGTAAVTPHIRKAGTTHV
jgi:hypothetical protein